MGDIRSRGYTFPGIQVGSEWAVEVVVRHGQVLSAISGAGLSACPGRCGSTGGGGGGGSGSAADGKEFDVGTELRNEHWSGVWFSGRFVVLRCGQDYK